MSTQKLIVRRSLLVPLADRRTFFNFYFEEGRQCGIRLPLESGLAIGERCDLEVAFAHESVVLRARGVARWRRMRSQPRLAAGVGVVFEPDQSRTRELLLAFARGSEAEVHPRVHRRFPVEMTIDYAMGGAHASSRTDDLSLGGCFILASDPPPIGTPVEIALHTPGDDPNINCAAEIVWSRRDDLEGFGVRFTALDPANQTRLKALLAHIKTLVAKGGSI